MPMVLFWAGCRDPLALLRCHQEGHELHRVPSVAGRSPIRRPEAGAIGGALLEGLVLGCPRPGLREQEGFAWRAYPGGSSCCSPGPLAAEVPGGLPVLGTLQGAHLSGLDLG